MSCFVTSDDISLLSSPYSRTLMEETSRYIKAKFANVLLFAFIPDHTFWYSVLKNASSSVGFE